MSMMGENNVVSIKVKYHFEKVSVFFNDSLSPDLDPCYFIED
jgi:hypothetical protein